MTTLTIGAVAAAAVTLSACGKPPPARVDAPPLQVFGSVHEVMMEGSVDGKVGLGEVATGDGAHGLGALSGLRGEATVIAGETCLAYPDGPDRIRVELTRAPTEDAALFVVANVSAWLPVPIPRDLAHGELDGFIGEAARSRGWDGARAFPFVIEGPVRRLAWHVVDGSRLGDGAGGHGAHLEASVRGELTGGSPVMVGFYSTQHQGVFTHHGAASHIHFIDRARRVCGHVDDVGVGSGAVLRLPAATTARPGGSR